MIDIKSDSCKGNYAIADLLKKIIFFGISFGIMRFNYDNSISVGALLQNYIFLNEILFIFMPIAILIMVYYLKEHNYKCFVYIGIISITIFLIDVLLVESADIIMLEKFIKYYPIYIILTYAASFMTDLASADFRNIKKKIQDTVDILIGKYVLKIVNIFIK